MSISTIYIKKPLSFRPSLNQVKETFKGYNATLSFLLWAVNILYSAARTSFTYNVSGITLAIPILDVILLTFATILLYKGLETKNIVLTTPWILLNMGSIYFNHYKGLTSMLSTLKHVTKLTWGPWSALIVSIMLLFVRLILTIKVLQLCANLWFKQKIDELRKK